MEQGQLTKQYTNVNSNLAHKKNNKLYKPPVKRLLLPSIIFVALITQIPFIVTIFYSLHSWNIMRPDRGITFNGVKNFMEILTTSTFYKVLGNTFLITLATLSICFVVGMLFALLMNRNFFGKGIVRTMLVSSFFVMPTVSSIIWKTMVLNPNFGFSAYFAELLHNTPVDWLAQRPLLAIILIVSWQWIPFFMLILLAGLQSLSPELIEAAQLDGANKVQQFFYVMIPHLIRYIEVVLLLGLMFILQVFGEIYVTTSGGPGFASTNLSFYVYRIGFQSWDVGTATTVGVITVILTIILMMALFTLLRKAFKEELS
ncbi:carbohydrate ABC transporter permease [Bacillus alveayuensis]|jgi:sorbitol/mannitol transport system permease protein|uniref:carbohydrate ABC transporter permease n=1 Tax=Aeribacillus alveayuensis TaxID=279215 RepID=UPI00069683A1|nr:sugar ABC transporter permease [Bacillus alveayuensis]